jgi:predicted nucleotidyltransferase
MSNNVKPLPGLPRDLEARIRTAAAALRAAGAREVYLFGSAARAQVTETSDIDLAVSGPPPEGFFRAMGDAREILRKSLDLIDLDEDTPFARYLKQRGEMILIL